MTPFKHKHISTLANLWIILLISVSTNHSLADNVHKNQPNSQISSSSKEQSLSSAQSYQVEGIYNVGDKEYAALNVRPGTPILLGSKLDLYRNFQGRPLKTASITITEQSDHKLIGLIVENGSQASRILSPDYPGAMVGDLAKVRPVTVQKMIRITPTKVISYFDIFEDPQPFPQTFEISENGRNELKKQMTSFQKSKLPTLLIEAHTDAEGDAKTNQVESYQRALTIRQYLIDELGFDPERLIAIGMGEIEPVPEPYLPDHNKRARRIVIKAKGY